MRKISKKLVAVAVSATMIVGSAMSVSAAVSNGTDVVATGKAWSGFSIYTHEDHVASESKAKKNICWYHSLLDTGNVLTNQHYVGDPVTDAQIKELNAAIKENNTKKKTNDPTVTKHAETWGVQDSHKCFGENATIKTKSASGFLMDIVSTGWSATWTPMGTVAQSNPWGVTATKVVNVDRGRTYNVSFKIKSTLKNEIEEEKEREDKTYYNVVKEGSKPNTVKHIHFKLYDNTDANGAALKLTGLKATQGGVSVSETNKTLLKDYANFIKLDSANTADDGWVTISFNVKIPSSLATYQSKRTQATVGFKFAFGAFLKEYLDENNMSGTIEVKDMKFVASTQGPVAPATVKAKKVKKTSVKISFKKGIASKKYEVQYGTKYDKEKQKVSGGKVLKATAKKSVTIKKLKSNKKYFIRVRSVNGSLKSDWSKVVKVKTKK